ncbi:MAG: hypothetical protein LBI06_03370 [Treponema sp.]|nr:hypothetical protein [Treponema sp.]
MGQHSPLFTLSAIEAGDMTSDLARIARPAPAKILNSWEFVEAIAGRVRIIPQSPASPATFP